MLRPFLAGGCTRDRCGLQQQRPQLTQQLIEHTSDEAIAGAMEAETDAARSARSNGAALSRLIQSRGFICD